MIAKYSDVRAARFGQQALMRVPVARCYEENNHVGWRSMPKSAVRLAVI
jgi:hypothetical protein